MKTTYGFTFLVVLGAMFLTGPQSVSVSNDSASAPIVHVTQTSGGALL